MCVFLHDPQEEAVIGHVTSLPLCQNDELQKRLLSFMRQIYFLPVVGICFPTYILVHYLLCLYLPFSTRVDLFKCKQHFTEM
jgi:hypothetical protein